MGGKSRESARQERRRKAWWEVQTRTTPVAPLDEATARELVAAIDKNRSSSFGIEKLCRFDLDAPVGPVAPWVKRSDGGRLSLVRYAALRGRLQIVAMLLRGGASAASFAAGLGDGEAGAVAAARGPLAALAGRETAAVFVAAARMAEGARARGVAADFAWLWVVETRIQPGNHRRVDWAGCGCAVSDPLPALCARRREGECLRCPACGALGGLAAPVFDAAPEVFDVAGAAEASRARWLALDDRRRKKRSDTLHGACRRGDALKVRRLVVEGCDVDAPDDCGLTPALVAALRRDAATVEALREAGADVDGASAVSTPDGRRVRPGELLAAGADDAVGPAPIGLEVVALAAADAYVVRRCVSGAEVAALRALFAAAPPASGGGRQCGLERRHFVDARGWLRRVVRRALPAALVAPRCKFVRYVDGGAEMAPHVDLSKPTCDILDAPPGSSTSTTHTWVLYLEDCPNGGATATLADVRDRLSTLDVVFPEVGKLLVFPHRQPHAGRPTSPEDPPKLIARGELLMVS